MKNISLVNQVGQLFGNNPQAVDNQNCNKKY